MLPAAFAAGAAVAEIAVGLTLVATRTAQRQTAGRWPYVVLAAVVVLRLAQEGRRLSGFDPVNSGWVAVLPAVGLVAAFAGLGWLISRFAPVGAVPVASLPDDLGRIAVPVGAAVIAMLLPVYVFLFGFQIVVGLNPARRAGRVRPESAGGSTGRRLPGGPRRCCWSGWPSGRRAGAAAVWPWCWAGRD